MSAEKNIVELTYERLVELFDYNPETGEFFRRKDGKKAGFNGPNGYFNLTIDHKIYSAGRLAYFYMTKKFVKKVYHLNGDRSDDRIINIVDFNKSGKKSGVTGVSYRQRDGLWTAKITINKKHIYLGATKTKEEAIALRKEAEEKLTNGLEVARKEKKR